MPIYIQLGASVYEDLLHCVPICSQTYTVMTRQAGKIYGVLAKPPVKYVVSCEEEEALELLKIAENFCPQAIPEIKLGLRLAQRR